MTAKEKVVIDSVGDTGERLYYVKNHLGSTRVTVNQDAVITGFDDYDPWGMQLGSMSLSELSTDKI